MEANSMMPSSQPPINDQENIINNAGIVQRPVQKKSSKILLVTIVIAIVITVVAIMLLFIVNGNTNNNFFDLGEKTITSNEIDDYGLENDTIWVNKALNVVYDIPQMNDSYLYLGNRSFCYIHGCSFRYGKRGNNIYVDKSLESHTNLDTLASDIIGEKNSEKYKHAYNFGTIDTRVQFENLVTEKIKVGDISTAYFESDEINIEDDDDHIFIKIIGYSFEYDGQFISVYGEVDAEDKDEYEYAKQIMQYIIRSVKSYNGESIQELGGNVKNYYDSGYTSSSEDKEKYFTINYLSSRTRNGVLRNSGSSLDVTVGIDPNKVNWDGTLEGILEATQSPKLEYDGYYSGVFPWFYYDRDNNKNDYTVEILKEDDLKINDIDVKKYVLGLKSKNLQERPYVAAYTFIYDGVPYVTSYRMSTSLNDFLPDMSDEQKDVLMRQTELIGDLSIITLRIVKNEEFTKYVDLFL